MKISQASEIRRKKRFDFSPRVKNARIRVICGPMFSGKTRSLIQAISEQKNEGKKVLVFKPKVDDRYADEAIVSHDKDAVEAFNVSRPKEILDYIYHGDVIAIDEVQFFDESVVQVVEKIANEGKSVICAGLDMDYLGKPFGSIPTLMAIADEITKLNAVCTFCSGRARFSHRVSQDSGIVVLGEKDKYVPLCRSCYNDLTKK